MVWTTIQNTLSKFTAHLRLAVDFDTISGLLTFTLATVNPFSLFVVFIYNRSRVLPPPFLHQRSIRILEISQVIDKTYHDVQSN